MAQFSVGVNKQRRWDELLPYSAALLERELNVDTALRHARLLNASARPPAEAIDFIKSIRTQLPDDARLTHEEAWAHFHQGNLVEASELALELFEQRTLPSDIALHLNVAQQSGNWEALTSIIEKVWERRSSFDPKRLIITATIASIHSGARAMDIVREAVNQAPNDERVLFSAYSIAVRLGQEDLAGEWLQAVIKNPAPESNLKTYSPRELGDLLIEDSENRQIRVQSWKAGKAPLHLTARYLNAPLTRFLVEIPRSNSTQLDARQRQPVPIRNGQRRPIDCSSFRSLGLDATTIIVLEILGYLHKVIDQFDFVLVSPNIFTLLMEERHRLIFIQPSRILAAKKLLDRHSNGDFEVVQEEGPKELTRLVGSEISALISAAKIQNSHFVHDGPIYERDSYMEKIADLGALQEHLTSTKAIAYALHGAGRITKLELDVALAKLHEHHAPESEETAGQPILTLHNLCLDTVALERLQRVELLAPLLAASKTLLIHKSAVLEWRALCSHEQDSSSTLDVTESIRSTLRSKVVEGKVRFFPRRHDQRVEDVGPGARSLLEVLGGAGHVDAVAIDDRAVNWHASTPNEFGNRTPLLCCLDLLELLVQRQVISTSHLDEALHSLRKFGMYVVPTTASQLLNMLESAPIDSDGDLFETAHLRALREYIARLLGLDALVTPEDHCFLDSLWIEGTTVIRRLWQDEEQPASSVIARCNWVVDNFLPSASYVVANAKLDTPINNFVGARASFLLISSSHHEARQNAQKEWVERKTLAGLLPANAGALDKAVESFSAILLQNVERADESKYEDNI